MSRVICGKVSSPFLKTAYHVFFRSELVTEITFWDGVVVTPLEAAYVDKIMEPMYEDEVNSNEQPLKAEGMDTHT